MADEEDSKTQPEAAIKFFFGVSSAGIGLIAALAEKLIATLIENKSFHFFPQPPLPHPVFGFISAVLVMLGEVSIMFSIVCFVACIIQAGEFYRDTTVGFISTNAETPIDDMLSETHDLRSKVALKRDEVVGIDVVELEAVDKRLDDLCSELHDARRKLNLEEYVSRCAHFCLIGVSLLATAAFAGVSALATRSLAANIWWFVP
jgi:hypothetical protein